MKNPDAVRIVAYISDRTNRVLQAHASLQGRPKQALVAAILDEYAASEPLANPSIPDKKGQS